MKTGVKLIICSASLSFCLFSTLAYADADWGYKSKYIISFELIDKWECSIISESRFRDDMSDHSYTHLDVALYYEYFDWLEFGPGYRYITKSTDDGWQRENRPSINARLKWNWMDFELSDNNKLEYRIRPDDEDVFRYRNKLTIEYPTEWTALKISPYVSEEIFLDFDVGQLNRYRLDAGISMQVLKNSELCIGYQFANDKNGDDWEEVNYLVTYFKISF